MSDLFPNYFIEDYKECVSYRALQLTIADRYSNQKMRCPVHLSIGQEYWLPLIKSKFLPGDRCFSSHRSHSMYMALGGSIEKMIAELYGSKNGCVSGYGGSMHLKDIAVGLELSNPIVASSIPLAIGSAFSAKHSNAGKLTISYFGDGACEEGAFHECLNLASVYNLGILFICENNGYSCNTSYCNRQPSYNMSRFAAAHNIESIKVESTDYYDIIAKKINRAMILARENPVFLEVSSYRLYEHCGHNIDTSTGDRTEEEYNYHAKVDPVVMMMVEYKELQLHLDRSRLNYDILFSKYEERN